MTMTWQKFRKRPIIVEAVQFTGYNSGEIIKFTNHNITLTEKAILILETLEGSMTVSPQEWVIKGIKGEFYPCKPDIFKRTYEAIS